MQRPPGEDTEVGRMLRDAKGSLEPPEIRKDLKRNEALLIP